VRFPPREPYRCPGVEKTHGRGTVAAPHRSEVGGQGRGEQLGCVRQENFRRFARFGNEGENRLIVVYVDRRTRTMSR
jgi:hypothetical protein